MTIDSEALSFILALQMHKRCRTKFGLPSLAEEMEMPNVGRCDTLKAFARAGVALYQSPYSSQGDSRVDVDATPAATQGQQAS